VLMHILMSMNLVSFGMIPGNTFSCANLLMTVYDKTHTRPPPVR
jgi:hypothetical protein